MNLSDKAFQVIAELKSEAKKILGDNLEEIIIYGSYARGDNDPESDMDILLLVDGNDESIKKWDEQFTDVMFELTMKYEFLVSIMLISYRQFNRYLDVLPFYMNVDREGVRVYERRAA